MYVIQDAFFICACEGFNLNPGMYLSRIISNSYPPNTSLARPDYEEQAIESGCAGVPRGSPFENIASFVLFNESLSFSTRSLLTASLWRTQLQASA